MGQTAVPGVVRDARPAEHGDRRTGPSGATTSREPRGSRTPDEASRRGTGDRTGVRVDPGTGDTLPEEQTRGELSRTESEGTLQRRQAANEHDQQAGQYHDALVAGGSGADGGAVRSRTAASVSAIEVSPGRERGQSGHRAQTGREVVLDAARHSLVRAAGSHAR